MAHVVLTENPRRDVARYLRRWADPAFAEAQLKERQPSISSDRRRTRGRQVARLVHQGLEFLASAEGSTVLTKALPLFYGAENLAKAACLCRDPSLRPDDIRFHGLGGERETKRYSIKNLCCQVHQPRNDVWSAFFRLFNLDRFQLSVREDRQSMLSDREERYATAPPKPRSQLQLGELLRHLPELADDVYYAAWGHSYVVRAEDVGVVIESGPPRRHSLSFMLRHGHHAPTKAMILDRESDLLKQYERVKDLLDVVEYKRGRTEETIHHPGIRLDVFGETWMDFARGKRVFGEPILYFAALFVLSDVSRYQPEHWLRLLEDHANEAILIDRFLDLAVRKLPNLVLNELHQQLFLFRNTR